MTSLSYQIYREKDKQLEALRNQATETVAKRQGHSLSASFIPEHISFRISERSDVLYSSFRKRFFAISPPTKTKTKSTTTTATEGSASKRRWSVGTLPPQPPKLKELIQESGIWNELLQSQGNSVDNPTIQSILEERVDDSEWNQLQNITRNEINSTLQIALTDILSMDDQQPIPMEEKIANYSLSESSLTEPKIKSSFRSSSGGNNSRALQSSDDTVSTISIASSDLNPSESTTLHLRVPPSSEPESSTSHQLPPLASSGSTHSEKCQPIRSVVLSESSSSNTVDDKPEKHPTEQAAPPGSLQSSSLIIPSKFSSIPNLLPVTPIKQNRADEDISNNDHVQLSTGQLVQLGRLDSADSYQTMVSEITFLSTDTKSSHSKPMILDPRAPQYRMVIEQEQQNDHIIRTRNLSVSSGVHIDTLLLPIRKNTPAEDELLEENSISERNPMSHKIRPPGWNQAVASRSEVPQQYRNGNEQIAITSDKSDTTCDDERIDEMSLKGPFASSNNEVLSRSRNLPETPRDSSNPHLYPGNLFHLGGNFSEAEEESSKSNDLLETSLRGPFTSPTRSILRALGGLRSPFQESNPLLFPATLMSEADEQESICSSSLHRSSETVKHTNTPIKEDSKNFSYPRGLAFFPPSPHLKGKKVAPSCDTDIDLRQPDWNDPNESESSIIKTSDIESQTSLEYFSSTYHCDIVLDISHQLETEDLKHTNKIYPSVSEPKKTTISLDKALPISNAQYIEEDSSVAPKKGSELLQHPQGPLKQIDENPFILSSFQIESALIHKENDAEGRMTAGRSLNGIRVKMCPAKICYALPGGEIHVHEGYYSGPLNANFKMHGNGMLRFNSGDLYLGEFENGELHGVGMMSIKTGDKHQIFSGFFRRNEFVGEEMAIEVVVKEKWTE